MLGVPILIGLILPVVFHRVVSVLGPILFLVFVNDLPEVVSSMLYMFADDTKLYYSIRSPHDHLILQRDLDSLVDWCDK